MPNYEVYPPPHPIPECPERDVCHDGPHRVPLGGYPGAPWRRCPGLRDPAAAFPAGPAALGWPSCGLDEPS